MNWHPTRLETRVPLINLCLAQRMFSRSVKKHFDEYVSIFVKLHAKFYTVNIVFVIEMFVAPIYHNLINPHVIIAFDQTAQSLLLDWRIRLYSNDLSCLRISIEANTSHSIMSGNAWKHLEFSSHLFISFMCLLSQEVDPGYPQMYWRFIIVFYFHKWHLTIHHTSLD